MLLKKTFQFSRGNFNVYKWAKFKNFILKNNDVIRDEIFKIQMSITP